MPEGFELPCKPLGARTGFHPDTGVERNEENERDRLVSDAEFDAFLKFCRGNGHLNDDSPVKQTSDAGLRLALAAQIAYLT